MADRKARQALPAEALAEAHAPGALTRPEAVIEYPEEDGQPMAENGYQERVLVELATGIRMHFADREDQTSGHRQI